MQEAWRWVGEEGGGGEVVRRMRDLGEMEEVEVYVKVVGKLRTRGGKVDTRWRKGWK